MVSTPPITPKAHQGRACRCSSCFTPSSVLKIMTAREGVIVTALIAEMIVDTEIVTANWRKNWPVMPPNEGARHEHGAQHQGHRDDRPGHLIHRLNGRRANVEPGRHQSLDVLEHDDGVVHHDADRQHQAEEGDVVEAEPDARP